MNFTEESNKNKINLLSAKELFLLDSSAFLIFERWGNILGFNLLQKIQDSQKYHFFITNEVFVELHQKPPGRYRDELWKDILNAEGSMSRDVKFSSFPIDINGETFAIVINAISAEDFNQIWLCSNHTELTLISNDRKLLKAVATVLGGRAVGPSVFIKKFIKDYPEDTDLKKLPLILGKLKEKRVFRD